MTRINSNLDPRTLTDQHLMAEYRELPMIPAALRRSLKTKTKNQVLHSIPEKFTLNKGHVTFFYNKLGFLKRRYESLQLELIDIGFNIDLDRPHNLDGFDSDFYGDYEMTTKDYEIITERIQKRISEKPNWYRKTVV